ncbi:uncharacterized protein LOC122504405 [Leptopilina heterotoma]|uniref:uncharacterized protein LOC122504405 n=1 Tax=Leptopilina heterotoma TaxID=63436 RepID=UPI001CA9F41C|nr:uncharacterized protein LOC122504405 [Leptopilina heterotoma]
MESRSVAEKRKFYLESIQNFRSQGYNIYYLDETWCGANHTLSKGWVEYSTEKNVDNFDAYRDVQKIGNYRGGFVTPSGAGKRLIILHVGNENGFVESCMTCFIGNKGSADYHQEMNAQHFEEWFRHLLRILPRNSVVVLDQAPYHTMLDPQFRNPTTKWKKAEIIEWLIRREVEIPSDVFDFNQKNKPDLLLLARHYHYPKVYLLDKIAEEMRNGEIHLLWLPVAHCELNPIELIWAYVKKDVAKKTKPSKSRMFETCVRNP